MQVTQKNRFIQSFGGLNYINDYLNSHNFTKMIVGHLGVRNWLAQYNYADLIKQLLFLAAIGGDYVIESNTIKEQLSDHTELRIASPDTIEYAFQELRQKTKEVTTKLGKRHQINEHQGFNNLLVSLCSKYLLDSSNRYMMDYDGHIVD